MNNKLILDLGVRYDLVTGFAFDQDNNIIFRELQAAAAPASSRSAACPAPAPASRTSARSRPRTRTTSPRASASRYDVTGNGDIVLRGGVGRYYDFAYTNANILFAVIGAQSSFGAIYSNNDSARHQERRRHASSRSASRCRPTSSPTPRRRCRATRPRRGIKQPYTDQANLGFARRSARATRSSSRASTPRAAISARVRTSTCRIDGGPRRFVGHPAARRATPTSASTPDGRRAPLQGRQLSSVKKRWDGKLQLLG